MKAAMPDFPDVDGDGDTTEPIKEATATVKGNKGAEQKPSIKELKEKSPKGLKSSMKMKDEAMKLKEEKAPMKLKEEKAAMKMGHSPKKMGHKSPKKMGHKK